jgi:hypothetical protein
MPYTADSPILGAPQATTEQCAGFMAARPTGEYRASDVGTVIVPAYFALCTTVGVDPVLLIAQMIHETANLTSWWAGRPRRNPAGIGVTGRSSAIQPASGAWALRDGTWYEGVSFASWKDDAIPAHVGRVLAYALTDTQANPAQQSLIARALTYRALSQFRGEAPTLRGFGGRWAVPGSDYADRVAAIAEAITRA